VQRGEVLREGDVEDVALDGDHRARDARAHARSVAPAAVERPRGAATSRALHPAPRRSSAGHSTRVVVTQACMISS
jgi:hypothetical protein